VAAMSIGLLTITCIATAWAVREALLDDPGLSPGMSRAVLAIAEFPGDVSDALLALGEGAPADPLALLIGRNGPIQKSWIRQFPAPDDPGYLLFSGVKRGELRSVVELIRIADGVTLAQWRPDWSAVYGKITPKPFYPVGNPVEARAFDPVLLPGGDIVFAIGNALVRSTACTSAPVWVLNEPAHHSVELDDEGMIWVPSSSQDGYADNSWLQERVHDDALARVTPDGRLLERTSLARILRQNGLEALLLGTMGFHLNEDPIHLNSIQVARADTAYWRRGDLLISARHLSTLILYRPATGKILWHQTGPWLNQHSASFVDQHRIAVLDNHVVAGLPPTRAFLAPGHNRVLVYDFADGSITEPYEQLLAVEHPATVTEGVARVLGDGGLFFEETTNGRLLRFTRDRLLWSWVNDYDKTHLGLLGWSRYMTAAEAATPLRALAEHRCTTR
jgi:hypothetical protein